MTNLERELASSGLEYAEGVYRGAGTYRIRWEREGRRRTVDRWANNSAELEHIIRAFREKGCRLLYVRFAGA